MIQECQVCKRVTNCINATYYSRVERFNLKMIPFCCEEHKTEFRKHYEGAIRANKVEQFKKYYKIKDYQYVD